MDLECLKRMLLQEKQELTRRLEALEEGLHTTLGGSVGELSTYDNHPGDIATETAERSKDLALREDVQDRLVAVENALQKMAEGTYGRCDLCGGQIPEARLAVIPYADFCYGCQLEVEKGILPRRRPAEEGILRYDLRFPAGPVTGGVGYDGEDAWEDVARHGLSYESQPYEDDDRGFVDAVDGTPYRKENGMFFGAEDPVD
ncbi:MAG: TraR/DksA C4-type zinc finger protein [Desulfotomaculales bacterium]